MRKYSDLLPAYLDGENIRKHADIVEEQDLKLYNKISLLSRAFEIKRPILIEKIQTTNKEATITIHLNIGVPIRSVTTEGLDEEIFEEYTEEELVTETVLSTSVYSEDVIVVPRFVVRVETYDDLVFVKGYPENDYIENNEYDHDVFLSNIGTLLNIPRRQYKEYNVSDVASAIPEYMGKEVVDDVVQECSEDDYYYYCRLREFLDNLRSEELMSLMIKAQYSVKKLDSTAFSNVAEQISASDLPSEFLTDGELDISKTRGYVLYILGEGQEYSNIDNVVDDFSSDDSVILYDANVETKLFKFLEKYTPITRLPVLTKVRTPILTFVGTIQSNLGLQARLLRNASGSPLANVPLRAILSYFDGTSETVDVVTEGNGVATIWTEKILGTESIQFTLQSPLYKDIQNNIREYSIDDIELIWDTEEAWTNASPVIVNNEPKMWIIHGGYLKTMFPLLSNYSLRYTVIPRSTDIRGIFVSWIFAGRNFGYSIPYSYEQNKEYDIEVLIQEDILYFFAKGVFLKSFTARDSYFGVTRWFTTTNNYVSDVSFGLSEYTGVPRYISDENMWTFISRDTSSTDPVITEEGVIQLGKNTHHIYEEEQLNPAKRYIIHFYKQYENNTYLGMGVTGTTRPPNSSDGAGTSSNRGVISGKNKAKIYFEGNTWKIQFNDATPVSLNKNNDETRYIYFVTTTASNYAEVYSIFTEEPQEEE